MATTLFFKASEVVDAEGNTADALIMNVKVGDDLVVEGALPVEGMKYDFQGTEVVLHKRGAAWFARLGTVDRPLKIAQSGARYASFETNEDRTNAFFK